MFHLKNGLRFIYESSQGKNVTCVYLCLNVGSFHEPEDLRGVSHLIEHMLFKSTSKHDEKSLMSKFDEMGVSIDAYTEKSTTCFYFLCETKNLKACLDILSEMVIDAVFESKEYGKEQKVVYEENLQRANNPDTLLQDCLDMMLFEGTPYARPVDYVHRPYDRKKVVEYYRSHYVPEKMALSIVSSASYEEVKGVVEQCALSRFQRKESVNREKVEAFGNHGIDFVEYPHKIQRYTCKNGIKLVHGEMKNCKTVHVAVGFSTCPWSNVQSREIMKLVRNIFSRSLTGLLYNGLRTKYGISYSHSAFTDNYSFTGKFGIHIEIDSSKLLYYQEGGKRKKGLLPIVIGLLHEFIEKGPTESEWEIVKTRLRISRNIFSDSIEDMTEFNGKNFWFSTQDWGCDGHKGAVDEVFYMSSQRNLWDDYNVPATLEDCRGVIARYMVPSNMCIAFAGGSPPSFQKVEKCLNTFFSPK
jgi:predicted Zn-dependent peptidase